MDAPLDTLITVETPEHMLFPYRVAGPGARGVAWLIDAAFRLTLLLLLALILFLIGSLLGLGGGSIGLYLVAWFVMDWGWYTVLDAVWEGRSPGRVVAGLRVIREDGGPIGWRESILRNLLRPADSLPFGYVVGVLVCTLDTRFRRLGDLLAGTVVVHTGELTSVPDTLPLPQFSEADLALLPPRLQLTPAERSALERWLSARERLGAAWALAVAERVVQGFQQRHRVFHPDPVKTLELLIYAARQQMGPTTDAPAWHTVRALLPISKLDASQLQTLVRAYRSLCADLGRRRSTLSPECLAPLEALSAHAHARVYKTPATLVVPALQTIGRSILIEFPEEFRRQKQFMGIAAGLFLVPFFVAMFMSLGSTEFAEAILPADTLSQMEGSYSTHIVRDASENSFMAGFYVFNNVGIALRAAAAGIFVGLGSAWVLVYNGLVIGTVAGHLSMMGSGLNLLRFTSGHSAWELTAIVIAGGAGLRLGWSLIDTGGLTRLGSLRQVGPAIGRLAGGAAVMLLVAASIEGFWSGSDIPDVARAVFSCVQILLVSVWLSGVGKRAQSRKT